MPIKKDRLLLLADALDIVQRLMDTRRDKPPALGFDLNFWKAKSGCGTTACAVGWACELNLVPGLVLSDWGTPQYGGKYNIDAVAQAFGISVLKAINLFLPSYYPALYRDPKHVAARIRELVQSA